MKTRWVLYYLLFCLFVVFWRTSGRALSNNPSHYGADYLRWQQPINVFKAALHKPIFDRFADERRSVCLEFGCSAGHVLNAMPCAVKVGVEVNPAAVAIARDEMGLEVHTDTATLPSDYFDFVYSSSTLEHVECHMCVLRELYRVMKQDAKAFITVPGMAPAQVHGLEAGGRQLRVPDVWRARNRQLTPPRRVHCGQVLLGGDAVPAGVREAAASDRARTIPRRSTALGTHAR